MFKKNLFLIVLSMMCLLIFSEDEKIFDSKDCKLAKISTVDLKKAIKNKAVTIIDVNGTYYYEQGHIENALDVMANNFKEKIGKNKEKLIVVYSHGEQCVADKNPCYKCNANQQLREDCITEKSSCKLCSEKKEMRMKCNGNLSSDESSNATQKVAEMLKELDHLNIKCYCPGIVGWVEAGGDLVADKKLDKKKYDNEECKLAKISTINFKKAIKNEAVTIVDVNGTKQFAKGHISGSHDFNANGFKGRLSNNKADLIVVYAGGEQSVSDKNPCEKCNASMTLREKCRAEKSSCDICADKKEIRSNCVGNLKSIESAEATREAVEMLNKFGYLNVKCYCPGLKGWVADGGVLNYE